jgi:short-subunit dehydrogenase
VAERSPSFARRASLIARAARDVPSNLPLGNPLERRTLERAVAGKRVLITGASSGIGEALAEQVGAAGGEVVAVARTRERLDAVARRIRAGGGTAHVHPCDLTDLDAIAALADTVTAEHGGVDVLVNNAGRSIRRSVAQSADRIHDYQRTMELNYLGPVQLILKFLPGMRERRSGLIVNVSTMGLQVNTPRFSAYLGSKAALDAFSRSIASELLDDRVAISTVYMPLVRTPMIEPSAHYRDFPALEPEEAAAMIADAIANRRKRATTIVGRVAEATYQAAPRVQDAVVNAGYKLFPESANGDRR